MRSSTKQKGKNKEALLEISEATHRKQIAKGLDRESLLKPGLHRFQRTTHTIKPGEEVVVNGKVRVTIYLEPDIVEFFKAGGPDYETEISAALRRMVERGKYSQELLADDVLEKLAGRLAQTLRTRDERSHADK